MSDFLFPTPLVGAGGAITARPRGQTPTAPAAPPAPASRFERSEAGGGDDPLRYERAVRSAALVGQGATTVGGTELPARIGETMLQARVMNRFAEAWSDLPGFVAAVADGTLKLQKAAAVI